MNYMLKTFANRMIRAVISVTRITAALVIAFVMIALMTALFSGSVAANLSVETATHGAEVIL